MNTQEIHIEEGPVKKHPCDLCGRGELGSAHLHAGGYVGYAHEECAKIGSEAISRMRWWHNPFEEYWTVKDLLPKTPSLSPT